MNDASGKPFSEVFWRRIERGYDAPRAMLEERAVSEGDLIAAGFCAVELSEIRHGYLNETTRKRLSHHLGVPEILLITGGAQHVHAERKRKLEAAQSSPPNNGASDG